MYARMIHSHSGDQSPIPYGKKQQVIKQVIKYFSFPFPFPFFLSCSIFFPSVIPEAWFNFFLRLYLGQIEFSGMFISYCLLLSLRKVFNFLAYIIC